MAFIFQYDLSSLQNSTNLNWSKYMLKQKLCLLSAPILNLI